jgi:hypothetical protein
MSLVSRNQKISVTLHLLGAYCSEEDLLLHFSPKFDFEMKVKVKYD